MLVAEIEDIGKIHAQKAKEKEEKRKSRGSRSSSNGIPGKQMPQAGEKGLNLAKANLSSMLSARIAGKGPPHLQSRPRDREPLNITSAPKNVQNKNKGERVVSRKLVGSEPPSSSCTGPRHSGFQNLESLLAKQRAKVEGKDSICTNTESKHDTEHPPLREKAKPLKLERAFLQKLERIHQGQ